MITKIELDNGQLLDLAAHPLPDGVEDVVLNRELLAQALNVSAVTISKWVSAGMPVLSRGGNGTSYEFQLSHCYAWRMWQQSESEAARRRATEAVSQMAMHFLGLDETEAGEIGMSPEEVRKWSEAELSRAKAEELRGDLVRRHRVERVLQSLLSIARDAMIGYGDYLEAELGLGPREVDIVQARADQTLIGMRQEIERHLDGISAEVTPIRAALPDADRV